MAQDLLFDRIDTRIALDKEDGDHAYFHALSLKLEYLAKIVTAGIVACVGDDVDRQRYSLEHRLVRADSLGTWIETLHSALGRPSGQLFSGDALNLARDLTQRVSLGDWRYTAVTTLNQAAREIGVETQLGNRVELRQFFDLCVSLRNRSRGHGAPTTEQCARCCPSLADALDAVVENLKLFRVPWVHLHQNLSGKYRVSPLFADPTPFDYLKRERDVQLQDGVYFYCDRPTHTPLVFSDPEIRDIALPNGNYRNDSFETLSYVTNDLTTRDGSKWSDPPSRLPPSETEGGAKLEVLGDTFSNIPPKSIGYIPRNALEDRLKEELLNSDRHPIVSLTGPGGVGKTTIGIAAIREIAEQGIQPYKVILWISARDIDLLEFGPKPVSPRVVTENDIADAAADLLAAPDTANKDFDPRAYFQECLEKGALGWPTLFVLDNFETMQNPSDAFKWVDTYIRPPNKVLITTRFRSFVGDYHIEIGGMTDEQANYLIDEHASRLGVAGLLNATYKERLIRESDGHPYVIKILLGAVAKEKRAVALRRVMASSDDLLRSLFERTYNALSLAGQRVFLLLCSWRVFVPEVAVEAVSLRPGTERFDVSGALEELSRYSLVDRVDTMEDSEEGDGAFVGIPLPAAEYGRRKLEASPFRAAIEQDRRLLMEFGAGRRSDAAHGVLPRIDSLVQAVAKRASEKAETLDEILPVLEYLADRVPKAYLRLVDLVMEVDDSTDSAEQAIRYLRSFLEVAAPPDRLDAWLRLAGLCESNQDWLGAVHALSEAMLLSTSDREDMSRYANRMNTLIRDLKSRRIDAAWSGDIQEIIERAIQAMERRLSTLNATDCSRLAWLYRNNNNTSRALDIANIGLEREPTNEHCLNLVRKLDP